MSVLLAVPDSERTAKQNTPTSLLLCAASSALAMVVAPAAIVACTANVPALVTAPAMVTVLLTLHHNRPVASVVRAA